MTSNDAPAPGDRPPRRRALGRGPGGAPPTPDPPADPGPPGAGPAPETRVAPSPAPPPAAGTHDAGRPATGPGDAAGAGLSARGDVPVEPSGGGPGGADVDGGSSDAGAEAGRRVAPTRAQDASAATSVDVQGPVGPTEAEGAGSSGPSGVVLEGEAGVGHPGASAPDAVGGVAEAEGVPADGAGASGRSDLVLEGEARAAGPGASASDDVGGVAEAEDDDGRFKVRLANFEGPFDLLLQLIAKHKLDVTEVALSKVTDEFMAYIRAMGPDWDLDETTEFLVVAATLLDLKAARLLPAAEVEDEADLALLEARDLLFARLLQYRAYKQIADIFSRRLDDEARRHPRTVGLEPHHAELLPEVVISIGAEGFARLAVKAMQPKPKPQVYVDHIHAPLVSVQEQAGIVIARLKELGQAGFRELIADTDDTLTVVARFLALLELYREKAVALDQETALGELTVRWTGGDGDTAPTVTDEFDRPPEQPQEERKP